MPFATNDPCVIHHLEDTLRGTIKLISENQLSAFIQFEGMINGHIGGMPIMARSAENAAFGIYHSIVDGTEVKLSPL